MRIARPKRPEVAFKRKRGPPPQATKLLRYSMLAGIVLMILLAAIFLPRMFPDQTPVAVMRETDWRFDTVNATHVRLTVENITAILSLTKFRADFRTDARIIASIGTGLTGGNASFRFVDMNANGALDRGDYFEIAPPPTGCYRLEVTQVDVGRLSGVKEWGGCPSATFN